MKASRLGRVFGAEMGPSWMTSHAAYPTPVLLEGGRIRVFFNTRDAESRGCVAWVDVSAANPKDVLAVAQEPCLMPGALGCFDDRGVSNGSVHRIAGRLRLYYLGWNKSADVPFRNAIGLAESVDPDGERFRKLHQGPILDRSRFDPFTLSYPFVISEPGGRWRMYYGTSRGGGVRESEMRHVITEAVSDDGIDWQPGGEDVIPLEEGEFGLSRPWIVADAAGRNMLFSIRQTRYAIGVSRWDEASKSWLRQSCDLLGASTAPWEDEAQCYPATIMANGSTYLFYCGNGYGRTGFGVALLDTRAPDSP